MVQAPAPTAHPDIIKARRVHHRPQHELDDQQANNQNIAQPHKDETKTQLPQHGVDRDSSPRYRTSL